MTMVEFERVGAVGRIVLNRPGSMNAINEAMRLQLVAVLGEAMDDPEVRAIVVTGTGRHFCAGGDIAAFDDGELRSMVFDTDELIVVPRLLATAAKPIVAAVAGACVGGGLGVALGCDYVIAGRSARFGAPFLNIGLPPDTGVAFFLARRVGVQKAMRFILDNRVIEAKEAADAGLVDRLVDDETLQSEAMELGGRLADLPPRAVAKTKALLRTLEPDLETFLARELAGIRESFGGPEFVEGTAAFLEKRVARFG